jgi:DNA polymerase/3'-5' exonuclease PolX
MLETLGQARFEPRGVFPETQNALVANRLEEVAALLEEQDANPFRITTYRRANQTLRTLPQGVGDIL